MDDTSKKMVEIFYEEHPADSPLLICFLDLGVDTKEICVESAFTGDYNHGVVFMSSIITNLAMIYRKKPADIMLDIAKDLTQDSRNESGEVEIEDGKVIAEPKRPKLEVVSDDEPGTDE